MSCAQLDFLWRLVNAFLFFFFRLLPLHRLFSCIVQVNQVELTHYGVVQATKLLDGITSLTNKVRRLEASFTEAVSVHAARASSDASAASAETAFSPEKEYPGRIAASSQALAEYISTESKCMKLLAERVVQARSKTENLKQEVIADRKTHV